MTSNFFNFYPKRWRPDPNSRARAANRAWHAPRPRARAMAVESALDDVSSRVHDAETAQDPKRVAGAWDAPSLWDAPRLWGTRRPTGGRSRSVLARGRRRRQRIHSRLAAPNPNLACRALVDYLCDGQYGLIIIECGRAPEVAITSDNPGKVLFQASRFLQPGLVASVSEGVLLAVRVIAPTWQLNAPESGNADRSASDEPGSGAFRGLTPAASLTSLARPGVVANGILTISREWVEAVFGPPLSKRKWHRLRHAMRLLRHEASGQAGSEQEPEQ